jgi:hypothetical protein
MGTFSIIRPATIDVLTGGRTSNALSVGWYSNGNITDAGICNTFATGVLEYVAAKNTGVAIPTLTFGFDQSTAIFSLDGGSAISYNSLPVGFTITYLEFMLTLGSNFIGNIKLTFPNFTSQETFNYPPASSSVDYILVDTPDSITANQFIGSKIEFTVAIDTTHEPDNLISLLSLYSYSLVGEYSNLTFTYTIDTPNPIKIGHDVSVSSVGPDLGGLDLSATTSIDLTYLDNGSVPHTINIPYSNFTFINTYQLIFIIPIIFRTIWINLGITSRSITIVANINGTQFSGSITLGTRTILYENVSGIYEIVKGKTSDTVYDRTGTTLEVKIPNPFIKTGYIGT